MVAVMMAGRIAEESSPGTFPAEPLGDIQQCNQHGSRDGHAVGQ
jgi:hypothetical protein